MPEPRNKTPATSKALARPDSAWASIQSPIADLASLRLHGPADPNILPACCARVKRPGRESLPPQHPVQRVTRLVDQRLRPVQVRVEVLERQVPGVARL